MAPAVESRPLAVDESLAMGGARCPPSSGFNALTTLGVEARLEGLLEQAAEKEPSYGDFLDEVLACEVDARRSRLSAGASATRSSAVLYKTFEQFDFAFQPLD
ncbi:MAG TPA: hypothetical protein VN428_02545 [Bryobacteraceae bacterium]|nr:hypothetical protein [Bryobacteraceae bacterium]